MKIITRGVIDMATSQVLEEESYEYDGPVAELKGGGGTSTNTIQNADPWSEQQGYLKDVFSQAQNLYYNYNPQYYPGQTYATRSPETLYAQQLGLQAAGNFADQASYAGQNMLSLTDAQPYQVGGSQTGYYGKSPSINYQGVDPTVNTNLQNPNIQFQGQDPNIQYDGQGAQINYQGQDPNINFQAQDPNIQFDAQNPQIQFDAQNPNINYDLLNQQIGGLGGAGQVDYGYGQIPDYIYEQGGIAQDALQQQLSGQVNTDVYDQVAEAATRRYMQQFEDASQQTIQNLQQNVLPSIDSDALVMGGYGGSRQGIAEGLAGEAAMEDIIREQQRATQASQDISTQIFGDAYTLAQQLQSRGVDQATALQMANQQVYTDQAKLQSGMNVAQAGYDTQYGQNLAGIYGSLAGQQGQMDLSMQQLLGGLAGAGQQAGYDTQIQQLLGGLAGQQGQLDLGLQQLLGGLAGQQGQLDLGLQQLLGGLAGQQGQLDQSQQQLLAQLGIEQGGMDLAMQQLYGNLAGQQGQLDLGLQGLLADLYGQQGQMDLGMQQLYGGLAESQAGYDLGFEQLLQQNAYQNAQLGLDAQGLQGQFYDDAMNRAIQAGAIFPTLGQIPLQMTDVLGQYGRETQMEQQQAIDQAINQWNFYQQSPYSQLAQYQNMIQGSYGGSTSSLSTTSGGSGGMLGALGGGIGGYMMGSSLAGTSMFTGAAAGSGMAALGTAMPWIGAGLGILSLLS
jgi:hypothetical protein